MWTALNMSALACQGFYADDDWFIASEPDKRLLIAGFDRHLRLDEELEAFVTASGRLCAGFVGAFNVIFWCGPGVDEPDRDALRQFELMVRRLRREGARRFGLVSARGARLDPDALETRLGGGVLIRASTMAEAERLLSERADKGEAAVRAANPFALTVG